MTFQPDTIISWDFSKNDYPVIQVAAIMYSETENHLITEILQTIVGHNCGAISLNQIIANAQLERYEKLIKSYESVNKQTQEGEE